MRSKHSPSDIFEIQPSFLVAVIRCIYALTTGVFGRGFNFALRTLCKVFPSKKATVRLADDSVFQFDLDDFYWNRIALKHYRYEPELSHALYAFRDMEYVFLDCGANIGYWSVLASSEKFGKKKCIAIEASPKTFESLQANADLNGSRFAVLNNAIFNEDGHEFSMSNANHHASRQIESVNHGDKATVQSVTLDTLVKDHNVSAQANLIVKLDVEGQEINALKGAIETCKREILLAYEDHGKDRTHEVTQFVMHDMGLDVYYVGEQGDVHKIEQLTELDAIKTKKGVGYNFFGCKPKGAFAGKLREIYA